MISCVVFFQRRLLNIEPLPITVKVKFESLSNVVLTHGEKSFVGKNDIQLAQLTLALLHQTQVASLSVGWESCLSRSCCPPLGASVDILIW